MSAQYLAVLAAAVLFGLCSARWGGLPLRVSVLVAAGLPYQVAPILLGVPSAGGFPSLHPVTWIVLGAGVASVWRRGTRSLRVIRRYPFATAAVAILGISGTYWSFRVLGHAPGPLLIDQILVPFGLFCWTRARIDSEPTEAMSLPRLLVGIGFGEALIALGESVVGVTSAWGIPNLGERQAATLDQPLTLALLLATCIPLTVSLTRSSVKVAVIAVLLAGIVTTQSRTALIIGILGAAYVIFAARFSVGIRILVILVLPAVVLFVSGSGFGAGVASRFADDLGSTALRSEAADFFWGNLPQWLFSGHGVGASYGVAQAAGLLSSFESAFYMYSIDFGFIATTTAFGFLVIQVSAGRPWRNHALHGGVAATIACGVFLQGFSSIATESFAGVLLWLVVAISASPDQRQKEGASARSDSPTTGRPTFVSVAP